MFKLKQLLQAAAENGGEEGGAPGADNGADGTADISKLNEQIESLSREKEAMQNKMNELLGETKRAKMQARQEAEEKARKEGDFEQLHRSSQEENERLSKELESLRNSVSTEKVNNTAMKLASELAEGSNAELLSRFIQERLKFADGGIKVLNSNGDLTVSTLDQLKSEFESDPKFKSLLKGSQASGGGASGSSSSSSTDKVMTRSEFDNANAADKAKFVKSGGKVVD